MHYCLLRVTAQMSSGTCHAAVAFLFSSALICWHREWSGWWTGRLSAMTTVWVTRWRRSASYHYDKPSPMQLAGQHPWQWEWCCTIDLLHWERDRVITFGTLERSQIFSTAFWITHHHHHWMQCMIHNTAASVMAWDGACAFFLPFGLLILVSEFKRPNPIKC